MKRFALLMTSLPALFILFFTSCEVTENYYLHTETITYSVRKSDWNVGNDNSGAYLYYTFREPLLTHDVLNRGAAVAYLSYAERLSPLPFSDFWIDARGIKWEEQVTCELEPGKITFIFKADDHILDTHYDYYDFVLKLMW
jgi:hypothetical protein